MSEFAELEELESNIKAHGQRKEMERRMQVLEAQLGSLVYHQSQTNVLLQQILNHLIQQNNNPPFQPPSHPLLPYPGYGQIYNNHS